MAYIEPNTELRLLHDVPLDPDYENTLYFDNIQQQTEYFLAKTVHTFPKQSYTRKSRGWVRLGWNADQWPNNTIIQKLYDSTYMMFKNTNFENKWFYAFVDQVEYVNNNTVDVRFHIDVMQSWHFDYVLNECFIERQHTTSDVIGENTVPEQLETGPYYSEIATYVKNGATNNSGQFEFEPGVCLVTSFDPSTLYDDPNIHTNPIEGRIIYGTEIHGNMYSGAYYTLWPLNSSTIDAINDVLSKINTDALINGVVSIFMFPYDFRASILDSAAAAIQELSFARPTRLGDYVPRNRKLYTYPYMFLYVSNNQGNSAEYMYEYFKYIGARLLVWGNVSPNAGMMCWPYNYKGVDGSNKDEALTLTGFPMCSWSYDSFKAWLSQNAGTITAAGIGLGLQWAATIASGNPLNLITGSGGGVSAYGRHLAGNGGGAHLNPSGSQYGVGYDDSVVTPTPSAGLIGATLGAVGQVFDHARKPPQAVGNGNVDLNYQCALMTFNFYNKHIREEYAKIIDEFFDMYGYALHRVDKPNRAARPCYTYVKTIGCSIHGNFPADDMMEIQSLFNRGIRFWRHTSVFGNYSPNINDNRAY